MNQFVLKNLQKRDPYCPHCGSTDTVPHHRKNRQMGGSKLLDTYENLLMVCAQYNGLMESDAKVAAQAREYGHKVPSWDSLDTPVFDMIAKKWFTLDSKGNKTEVEEPQQLF